MEGSGPIPRECLQRNLERVRAHMAEAAARASRAPDAVRLVAVTKTVGAADVQALAEMGVSDFGESRVQDAERKIRELSALADKPPVAQRMWHLIGHLQTNKADKAARLFQAMHAVDSLRVAQALDKERAKANLPPLPCLLEVNVAGEASKFGLRPDAAEICELLKACAELPRLRVTGLMTMAPYAEEPEPTSRPVFRRLRELRDEINARGVTPQPLSELSMGMSQDYAIAIEEGATLVRVGSTLFEH